jgi:hypothetical protein
VRDIAMSYFFSSLLILGQNVVLSQTISWQGQLSGWLTGNQSELPISQVGFRYIPDVFIEKRFNNNLLGDAEISFNAFATGNFNAIESFSKNGKLKPYRLWVRFAGNQFEARIGLQKINFGSAMLFRPLMWFDCLDPRDPLQLTDGVYGLLLRYYFQNNANIWLWGLYDNNDLKGWERVSTEDNGIEFGGRFQIPIFTGEAGISYHHRRADFSQIPYFSPVLTKSLVDENRFAFDGKWDVEIGLWFEGTIIYRNTNVALMKYQWLWTLGTDYTFNIGNGLHIMSEFFNSESSDKFLGLGEGISFSGLSADYPIGLLDRVSGIYYYDWTNRNNYFWVNWQRTYDDWMFYLIGFFNPETVHVSQTRTGSSAFAGNGFQIMVVFNH